MQSTTHKNHSGNSGNFAPEFQKLSSHREPVYVKGQHIYNAAVEGAKRCYNRSTNDHTQYEKALAQMFQKHLDTCTNREERRAVIKKTKGDWRNAYLPICLALHHHHKAGVPCETHARVFMPPNFGAVFDIPLEHWDSFVTADAGLAA
jgi:hypothetical protein